MKTKVNVKTNAFYSICYQVLVTFLPLVTSPYISRVFGAQAIGVYSYTHSVANYFFLFAMLGVNKYGAREIARVRDDEVTLRKTFWGVYIFQAIVSIFVAVCYLIYVIFFKVDNSIFYLLQGLYVMSAIMDINWALFGMERFKLPMIRNISVRLVETLAIFLFVHQASDLWLYTLILSLGSVVSAFSIWPTVLSTIPFMHVSCRDITRHIQPNLMLFWPVLAVSLYNLMDKLMLGWYSTSEEIGYYVYAERIIHIPTSFLLALENVLMPRMSNVYANGKSGEGQEALGTVLLIAMGLGSAMAFGTAALGPTFASWFYGASFYRCGTFIMYLSPVILFKAWAGALRTQYIIPVGKDRLYLVSLISGALVNLLLNFFLIPMLGGIGAIIGTISAEAAVAFLQYTLCCKELPLWNYIKDGIVFIGIGAGMYFLIMWIPKIINRPFFCMLVQICLGIVTFFVGTYLFVLKHKGKQWKSRLNKLMN